MTFAQKLSRESRAMETASSHLSTIPDDDSMSIISEGQSLSHNAALSARERSTKTRMHATEHVWKQIFEPSLEYAKVNTLSSRACYYVMLNDRTIDLRTNDTHAKFTECAFAFEHDSAER